MMLWRKSEPETFRKQLKHLFGRGTVVAKAARSLNFWNRKSVLKIDGSVVEHTKEVLFTILFWEIDAFRRFACLGYKDACDRA